MSDTVNTVSDMNADSLKYHVRFAHGFTLLETMMVMAIIGILAAIAVPNYMNQREKAKVAVAIADIKHIAAALQEFCDGNGAFPATLADAGLAGRRDPWGNAYEYWPITGEKKQKVRKDRNTHPINSDFDLYSKGGDGKTNFPVTANASQDDIIRANNGGYIGLASDY